MLTPQPVGVMLPLIRLSIIAVFDADSGQLLHSLIDHGGGVKTLAFSPDNHRFASGGEDKTISVWSAN